MIVKITMKPDYHCVPVKHPLLPLALAWSTRFTDFKEHGLKFLLFILSPEVARANMM